MTSLPLSMPPSAVVLPTFQFEGTDSIADHHRFGLELGTSFASTIKSRFRAKASSLDHLQALAKTSPSLYHAFVQLHEDAFPLYMAELRGLSEGSGESFERVFLQNIPLEFSDCTAPSSSPPLVGVSCSDFMTCDAKPSTCAVAHNEDNNVEDLNRTALVSARISNHPAFHAYTYMGELPSGAFAWNDAGIGFTLNWVGPAQPVCPGLGRGFLSRKLLEATTLESAVAIASDARGSTGHNYQLMWWGGDAPQIVNVEAAPRGLHSVRPIREAFFHANQYVTLALPQVYGNSSIHRTARAATLLPSIAAAKAAETRAAMLNALGDQVDHSWPIFHDDLSHKNGDLSDWTIASAFFDLHQRTVDIFAGNPSHGRILANHSLKAH